jgi:hypothetical protein
MHDFYKYLYLLIPMHREYQIMEDCSFKQAKASASAACRTSWSMRNNEKGDIEKSVNIGNRFKVTKEIVKTSGTFRTY